VLRPLEEREVFSAPARPEELKYARRASPASAVYLKDGYVVGLWGLVNHIGRMPNL